MRSWKTVIVFCAEKEQLCYSLANAVPDGQRRPLFTVTEHDSNPLCTRLMSSNNTYEILKFSIRDYILCLISKSNHFVGNSKSNSNSKSKSSSNSKSNSNSTQQQHQQQQQQKLSETYKQPVWQAAGLARLLFEYSQIF